MRVADIGTGAAGYTAISTLRRLRTARDIVVFDPDPAMWGHLQVDWLRKINGNNPPCFAIEPSKRDDVELETVQPSRSKETRAGSVAACDV